MADVRSYTSGTPTVATFADLGAPFPGGTPLVIDTATGDGYVLVAGVVTKVASASFGTGTIGGSTGSIDNAILRANGTGGSTIQGQTSGGPILNDDGSVVNTVQPAFLAYNSAPDANVTGDGTFVTVDFDTEVFDQGGDFSADTFTAPVTGRYQLTAVITLTGMTAANDGTAVQIVTSNRTYSGASIQKNNFVIESAIMLVASGLCDMDASDTAIVYAWSTGEAGKVISVYGDANATTFFSGHLVC